MGNVLYAVRFLGQALTSGESVWIDEGVSLF